jgi:hypothetical protein
VLQSGMARSWHSFMSLISSSPTQVCARAAAIDARASAHICSCCRARGPADSGQLQIKEVLPIPYTMYISRSGNLVWTATPLNTIEMPRIPTLTTQAIKKPTMGARYISAIELRNLK